MDNQNIALLLKKMGRECNLKGINCIKLRQYYKKMFPLCIFNHNGASTSTPL